MVTKKPKKLTGPRAVAIHTTKGQVHCVGFGPIRVMISTDDGGWYAQGLEIDFAASGDSLNEVKEVFQRDLVATIHENLRIHGSIEKVLQVAPQKFWTAYFEQLQDLQYTQVSLHVLPRAGKPRDLPFNDMDLVFCTPDPAKVA